MLMIYITAEIVKETLIYSYFLLWLACRSKGYKLINHKISIKSASSLAYISLVIGNNT